MFGLCMPTGSVYLVYNDGHKEIIASEDLVSPRKEIMEDKHILKWVQIEGYNNIQAIEYERYGKRTIVTMPEYYAEHGQELERK